MSQAITASLQNVSADGSQQSADASYASAESLAQLGQRLATTQLLRDELSDLCRSYANGAISTTNYTLRLAQLDEKMVTLLTAEMIAGAFQRDSVAISGSTAFAGGGGGGTPVESQTIEDLDAALVERQGELSDAREAELTHISRPPTIREFPDGTTPTPGERERAQAAYDEEVRVHDIKSRTLREKVETAEDAVDRANARLIEARRGGGGGAGVPSAFANVVGGQSSSWFGSPNTRTAEHLVELQQNYLDRDEVGGIVDTCLTRMNEDMLFAVDSGAEEDSKKEREDIYGDLARLTGELAVERRVWNSTPAGSDAEAASEVRLADLEGQLAVVRARLQDGSINTAQMDALCSNMMIAFSQQLMRAQNTRLALELKEMEADVQKAVGQRPDIEMCTAFFHAMEATSIDDETRGAMIARMDRCFAIAASYTPTTFLGDLPQIDVPSIGAAGAEKISSTQAPAENPLGPFTGGDAPEATATTEYWNVNPNTPIG